MQQNDFHEKEEFSASDRGRNKLKVVQQFQSRFSMSWVILTKEAEEILGS